MPARRNTIVSSRHSSSYYDDLIRKPSNVSHDLNTDQVCRMLKMSRQQLLDISNEVKKLAVQHLDLDRTYTKQRKGNIDRLKKEALQQIPLLRQYEEGWATPVLIKRLYRNKALPNIRRIKETLEQHSSYTPALRRNQRTESPPAPHAHPLPSTATTLLQFLEPIKPDVSECLLPLVSTGLLDDDRFQKFLTRSLNVKKSFFQSALKETASEQQLKAILDAIEKLDAMSCK